MVVQRSFAGMGRPKRGGEGGLVYDVLNSGNGRMRVFYKDADYEAFETILACRYQLLSILNTNDRGIKDIVMPAAASNNVIIILSATELIVLLSCSYRVNYLLHGPSILSEVNL